MSDFKRYNCVTKWKANDPDDCWGDMAENPHGEYVEYDDYAKLVAQLAAMTKERDALAKVVEAARCIRHWHDAANDGMIVSGEHVRKLWVSLNELDDAMKGAE